MGKRKTYSPRRVAAILQEYAAGTPAHVLCARTGVSRSTLYRWRVRASASAAHNVADENKSLRRRVDELAADKALLQEILRRGR